MNSQCAIPRLAFGEAHASHDGGVGGLLAAQRLAHRSLRAYDPIGSLGDFRQKSATVTIGGLRLVASAHTPVRVMVDSSDDVTLMVPLSGWSTAVIEGQTYRWSAGRSAMYLPGVPRQGESGRRSTLAIGMDAARLRQVACSLNEDANPATIAAALATPLLVPLGRGGFSFATFLRQICGLIDNYLVQPEQLARLGIDDVIYRGVAMLLIPESEQSALPQTGLSGRRSVDRACSFIVAHLHSSITLEDLEAASGIKARALQMAFVKHLGCTPTLWILDRRLDAARERLTRPHSEQTVTSIALECGFTRLSRFTSAYKTRFGETPLATLARHRPR